MTEYTAMSFAPVQGFIEKSRKLRDLFGASLILSYLSSKLVDKAEELGLEVISPGLPKVKEGMPNRILIQGKFERNEVKNTLLKEWQRVLEICRKWIEENLEIPKEQYFWSQTEEQQGQQKGEWERWGSHTWEVFWGYGESVDKAMEDLETRKLKRDWIAINWTGESSSLAGTDAIAWHQLGKQSKEPWRTLNENEQQELKRFYHWLAWILDDPYARNSPTRKRNEESIPSDKELDQYFQDEDNGKFLAPNEKLSIPELVKRLATLPYLAKKIGMKELDEGFKDITREAGYWTGWFMGDGDKVGDKLKQLATRHKNDEEKHQHDLKRFTEIMRQWGQDFKAKKDLFPQGKGRVIYAGGDDFLGVLYSEETKNSKQPEKVQPIEVLNWLLTLEAQWKDQQKEIKQELGLDFSYSVGFVWAGHQVPQRDILQHCREAEKWAKKLGRDRVTIRVVFNSGQYLQWTCPWDYLHILKNYRDRDGKTWGDNPNWNHIYNDWAQLKAHHAIRLKDKSEDVDDRIALAVFNLYFRDRSPRIDGLKPINKDYLTDSENSKYIIKNVSSQEVSSVDFIKWIDGLISIGWQLCSNS